ncbi:MULTISPECIES: PQQ-binding-like beta-propeller repeat protein [Natrialbaceae]|uniref:PQQ-binding-like beta-propeller repeat protein n=1 Tax=Natrialbaceae TaxID=1644061 RepID=UPI00207C8D87|nr:PQQ-binding-like beta-propeller repeat protein [Natronococcus sp. CG52]
MATWRRRSVLASCAALSTTGALASINSTAAKSTGSGETTSSSVTVGDPEGWSSDRGNAANSRYLPLEDEFPEPDTEAWRYDFSEAGRVAKGRVAVVDGRVYVQTDTELLALDADDGELEWETEISSEGRPTVADDTVYVGSQGYVAALDAADGSVRWERELDTDDQILSPTATYGSICVVAAGALYALNAEDGSVQWDRDEIEVRPDNEEAGDPVSTSFAGETIAAVNGSVYAITDGAEFSNTDPDTFTYSGGIAALDAATGDREWGIVFEDNVPGSAVPIVTDEFVYAPYLSGGRETGPLLDPDTGEHLGDSERTVAGTSDVRITAFPGEISAHSYDSGENWTITSNGLHWNVPLVVGKTLVVYHWLQEDWQESEYPDPAILGFDLEDGSIKWDLKVDWIDEIVAVDENTVYAEIHSELVAFRASDEEPDESDPDDEDDPDDDESPQDDDAEDDPCCEDEDDNGDSDAGDGSDDSEIGDGNDDSGIGNDGESDEDDGVGGNGDDTDDGSNEPDDAGADDGATEPDGDDGTSGFTTGAGLLGGALGLEWLRRKAGVDESTVADEPAE